MELHGFPPSAVPGAACTALPVELSDPIMPEQIDTPERPLHHSAPYILRRCVHYQSSMDMLSFVIFAAPWMGSEHTIPFRSLK